MNRGLTAIGASLLFIGSPAFAHQTDEYLQATTISVEKNRIQAHIRLTPGVAVFPAIRASIDTDANGVFSRAEQRFYVGRVLDDVWLTVDAERLPLRLASWKFASVEKMKAGLGSIDIYIEAEVLHSGCNRRIIFKNHHQSRIAAYQVNCLVPSDPDIQVTAQTRNYQQSLYQLDYTQVGNVCSAPPSLTWQFNGWQYLAAVTFLLSATLGLLRRQRTKVASMRIKVQN